MWIFSVSELRCNVLVHILEVLLRVDSAQKVVFEMLVPETLWHVFLLQKFILKLRLAERDEAEVVGEFVGRRALIAHIDDMLEPGNQMKMRMNDLLALTAINDGESHLIIHQLIRAQLMNVFLQRSVPLNLSQDMQHQISV